MAITCLGCSLGHITNAATLYGEALKFERLGDAKMRDLHLAKALGEVRQAEEQHPFEETRQQIRGIRKRIEAAVAANLRLPDLTAELNSKAAEILQQLREHPELCPTCQRVMAEDEIDHE
jgi:uncharacterized membrane protein YccC